MINNPWKEIQFCSRGKSRATFQSKTKSLHPVFTSSWMSFSSAAIASSRCMCANGASCWCGILVYNEQPVVGKQVKSSNSDLDSRNIKRSHHVCAVLANVFYEFRLHSGMIGYLLRSIVRQKHTSKLKKIRHACDSKKEQNKKYTKYEYLVYLQVQYGYLVQVQYGLPDIGIVWVTWYRYSMGTWYRYSMDYLVQNLVQNSGNNTTQQMQRVKTAERVRLNCIRRKFFGTAERRAPNRFFHIRSAKRSCQLVLIFRQGQRCFFSMFSSHIRLLQSSVQFE